MGGGEVMGLQQCRGFVMGDLTEVGKSLITFLHYWWVLLSPHGNEWLCFWPNRKKRRREPEAVYLQRAMAGEAMHPAERRMDIGLGALQGCTHVLPYITGSHMPWGLNDMTWTLYCIAFGCQSSLAANWLMSKTVTRYIWATLRAADRCGGA